MVQTKKSVPPGGNKKGGKNKGQGMKTGKNFVKGNKGPRPRPLMSLCPGPGSQGPPGFMRPGPYGPPPPRGPPGPFPPPMMGPRGPPFPPHPGPHPMWGPMCPPMPQPHFRMPMGMPLGPPGLMGPMRRGPMPLVPPQGMRRGAGHPPRRGGPGPIRKPIGKPSAKPPQKKKPEPKIDFTDDTIDIQSNKLGTAF